MSRINVSISRTRHHHWLFWWSLEILVESKEKNETAPKGRFEEDRADRIQARRIISRRNPVKTMFMGVVSQPQSKNNLNGKIEMKWFSRSRQLKWVTYQSNKLLFHINQLISGQGQGKLYDDPTYTSTKLLTLIADYSELDEDVATALCLRYVTHAGEENNRRAIKLRANETLPEIIIITNEGNHQTLTINDVTLSC